jgi:hypothetical protein
MAAQRQRAAPNTQAARASGMFFAWLGAVAALAGVISILTGSPSRAHDLAPLAGPGDVVSRLREIAPLLSAGAAAFVAAVIAMLSGSRRLDPVAAAIQLLILGTVVDVCVLGASNRIGHAADGSVLGAAILCVLGGSSIVAGAIVTSLGRE